MSLRKTQSKFAQVLALLIIEAAARGYSVTFGDAYRDPRLYGDIGEARGYGHRNSLHKKRLAVDLNLFDSQGNYITNSTGHAGLHDWWVEHGGNPMIDNDPNHYSWPWGVMR